MVQPHNRGENMVKLNAYTLEILGVYGRNRTEKFTSSRLRAVPVDDAQPDMEEIREMAESELSRLAFKRGRWKVVILPVERGEGYETITLSLLAKGEPPLLQGTD